MGHLVCRRESLLQDFFCSGARLSGRLGRFLNNAMRQESFPICCAVRAADRFRR